MMDMISREMPLYSYSISYFGDGMMNQYYKEYVEILMQEAQEGTGEDMSGGGELAAGDKSESGQEQDGSGGEGRERWQAMGKTAAEAEKAPGYPETVTGRAG